MRPVPGKTPTDMQILKATKINYFVLRPVFFKNKWRREAFHFFSFCVNLNENIDYVGEVKDKRGIFISFRGWWGKAWELSHYFSLALHKPANKAQSQSHQSQSQTIFSNCLHNNYFSWLINPYVPNKYIYIIMQSQKCDPNFCRQYADKKIPINFSITLKIWYSCRFYQI